METWWIVRPKDRIIVAPGRYVYGLGWSAKSLRSRIGPYWTRGEAARVLRLWNGFSG